MKKVADLLGVKLDEAFTIKELKGEYLLCSEALYAISEDGKLIIDDKTLRKLLVGECTVDWKPQLDEEYYIPDFAVGYCRRRWLDKPIDKELYNEGLVCKTLEGVEQLKERLLEAYHDR